jgi:protein-tyrosine kinase
MSKYYEAMQEAKGEGDISRYSVAVSPNRVRNSASLAFEPEMLGLYRSLDNLFPGLTQKAIMFLGTNGGEGATTVVTNLARVAAVRLDRNIGVLDADLQFPTQKEQFGIQATVGWDDVLRGIVPTEQSIYQTHDKRISVIPASSVGAQSPHIIDLSRMAGLIEALRARFDLVLIDCAPAGVFPDMITLSRYVDGVVLIIEAESTRGPVADRLTQQIIKAGGQVIGAVFNKRRYYIPEYIYKRI